MAINKDSKYIKISALQRLEKCISVNSAHDKKELSVINYHLRKKTFSLFLEAQVIQWQLTKWEVIGTECMYAVLKSWLIQRDQLVSNMYVMQRSINNF